RSEDQGLPEGKHRGHERRGGGGYRVSAAAPRRVGGRAPLGAAKIGPSAQQGDRGTRLSLVGPPLSHQLTLAQCSTRPMAGVGLADLPTATIRSFARYLARFSYEFLPVNRQRALDFIRREVEAAHGNGLNARLLVPLTRGHGDGPALQF